MGQPFGVGAAPSIIQPPCRGVASSMRSEILVTSFGGLLEKTVTVHITPKSIQHTGLAPSIEGSVAAWQVTFQLDENDSIHAAISIFVAGPPTHHEAQQKALNMLGRFLNDACEAASKFRFPN
jgi:hypothetical protein